MTTGPPELGFCFSNLPSNYFFFFAHSALSLHCSCNPLPPRQNMSLSHRPAFHGDHTWGQRTQPELGFCFWSLIPTNLLPNVFTHTTLPLRYPCNSVPPQTEHAPAAKTGVPLGPHLRTTGPTRAWILIFGTWTFAISHHLFSPTPHYPSSTTGYFILQDRTLPCRTKA